MRFQRFYRNFQHRIVASLSGWVRHRQKIMAGPPLTKLYYYIIIPLVVEIPLDISSRVGLVNCSADNLHLLAAVFMLYHRTKTRAKKLGGSLL